jgi:hypothetical protein
MNAASSKTARPKRSSTQAAGQQPRQSSDEARRRAAVVLEVLAGVRTPTEAAGALGIAVPRYYQIEQRALTGMVAACEPAVRGRQATPERQIAALRRQIDRLSQDSARYQSLARLSQRSLGLAPVAAARTTAARTTAARTAATDGDKKRRTRRPTRRALRLAAQLSAAQPTADSPGPASAAAVQQTPANS